MNIKVSFVICLCAGVCTFNSYLRMQFSFRCMTDAKVIIKELQTLMLRVVGISISGKPINFILSKRSAYLGTFEYRKE